MSQFFRKLSRSQIDSELSYGKFKSCGLDRSAHAIPAFADFCVGKAYQIERRQPVGEVNLNGNEFGMQSSEGAAVGNGE